MKQRCEFCRNPAQETSALGTHFCLACRPHFLEAACEKCGVRCVRWQAEAPVKESPLTEGICRSCLAQQKVDALSHAQLEPILSLLRKNRLIEAVKLSDGLLELSLGERAEILHRLQEQLKAEEQE